MGMTATLLIFLFIWESLEETGVTKRSREWITKRHNIAGRVRKKRSAMKASTSSKRGDSEVKITQLRLSSSKQPEPLLECSEEDKGIAAVPNSKLVHEDFTKVDFPQRKESKVKGPRILSEWSEEIRPVSDRGSVQISLRSSMS